MVLAIDGCQFTQDGSILVTYMDTINDVRNGGLVVQTHQIHVMPGKGGSDYADEIEDVRDALKRLVKDALDDFKHTDPVEEPSELSAGDSGQDTGPELTEPSG